MITREILNDFLLRNGFRSFYDWGWVYKTYCPKKPRNPIPYIQEIGTEFTCYPRNFLDGTEFIIEDIKQLYKYSDYLEQRKIQI